MSLVVRYVLCVLLGMLAGTANARDLYILVLGDQSAGSCHEHVYNATPGVFLLGTDGQERPAADSSKWGNCDGGSIWMPLATHFKKTARREQDCVDAYRFS